MSEYPIVACPKCGHEQEDMDGFGVIFCDNCKYCTHPEYTIKDGVEVCGICGEVNSDEGFVARTITYALRFDNPDISKAPAELLPYLRPNGVGHNGVFCLSLMEGDQIAEVEKLESRIEEQRAKLEGPDYILPRFRHAIDEELTPVKLVEALHKKISLYGEDPASVLDELFRDYNLTKVVAA